MTAQHPPPEAPKSIEPHPREKELNTAGDELYAFISPWAAKHNLTAWEYVDILAALLRHQTTKIRASELVARTEVSGG